MTHVMLQGAANVVGGRNIVYMLVVIITVAGARTCTTLFSTRIKVAYSVALLYGYSV